jgi:hypothetical protein
MMSGSLSPPHLVSPLLLGAGEDEQARSPSTTAAAGAEQDLIVFDGADSDDNEEEEEMQIIENPEDASVHAGSSGGCGGSNTAAAAQDVGSLSDASAAAFAARLGFGPACDMDAAVAGLTVAEVAAQQPGRMAARRIIGHHRAPPSVADEHATVGPSGDEELAGGFDGPGGTGAGRPRPIVSSRGVMMSAAAASPPETRLPDRCAPARLPAPP